ncbi:MAG TPA: aspartate aminotransferase family protein [Mycobacteriales bacterium]
MPFDLHATLAQRHGENYALHQRLLNPQLANVLQTLGFDRFYVRGEGCYLWDDQGERYFDTLAGFGVFALGRNHPAVKAALHEALDADLPNLVQMDCALLAGLLAEQLVARAHDGIERAVFTNSGAEAVEAAIKFARQSTGRTRILYADHAFHGLTTGALALNGSKGFQQGFGPLLPGVGVVPFGDLDALQREVARGDVAAFVVEPIQGKGVHLAPADYWQGAQEALHAKGSLLVADEVQTGLGRTGRFFAYEHYGITPDIITVSKALSGGYVPVGAMLTSDAIVRSVHRSMSKAMKHSSTFSRNQLAMVAGLATLTALDEEDVVAHAAKVGEQLRIALQTLVDRYEFFSEVRGEGLMIGIEFGRPEDKTLRRRFRLLELMRKGLFTQAIVLPLFHQHRIITQVAADDVNIIKLIPPLIMGQEEIDLFVGALDQVLAEAHTGNGLFVDAGKQLAGGAWKARAR